MEEGGVQREPERKASAAILVLIGLDLTEELTTVFTPAFGVTLD